MTRILHILDHSLPLHSGYTFRTRAIMKAQQAAGLEVRHTKGMEHNPLTQRYWLSADTSVNYLLAVQKPLDPAAE